MPSMRPTLSSFSSGEISPRYYLQADAPFVQKGLSHLENFLSTSQGPFKRRGGFAHTVEYDGDYGRIFPFTVSQATGFVVSVTNDGFIRVNDSAGLVIEAADQFVSNFDFIDGPLDWIEVEPASAKVTFATGLCTLNTVAGNVAAIQQEVTVTDGLLEHVIRVTAPSLGERLIIKIGTAQGGDNLASFDVTGLRVITKTFTPGINTFWIEISAPEDEPNPVLDKVEVFEPLAASVVEFAHPWDDDDIRNLQVAMPAGDFILYMVTPRKPPQRLSYVPDARVWNFIEVAYNEPPVEWSTDNYPGTITFFQGRKWLGGSPDNPETFWGTRSAEFEDYDQGSGAADDAVTFSLSARGRIEWMVGAKNLLIGTENSEHIITSEQGIIEPGDIQAERQSSYGSSNNQAEQIGNKVIYVSPDGRKVREMGFQWTDEGYISRDLTFIAEHITEQRLLTELIWVQNPENLIFGVASNGDLIGATYERGYDILGWHHHTTNGRFISITVLENFGQSQLWALCDRDRTGKLSLERYDPDDYIDSATTQNNDTPSATITAPHLADRLVTVVADGAVHPDVQLDGNGVGTLQKEATNVNFGLGFSSIAQTVPIDFATEGGSARLAMKRWAKLYVSIYASHKPLINGIRQPTRNPSTPMDTAEPAKTEYIETTALGYDRDAIVTIEQDLPVSCEVRAIFGELTYDTT